MCILLAMIASAITPRKIKKFTMISMSHPGMFSASLAGVFIIIYICQEAAKFMANKKISFDEIIGVIDDFIILKKELLIDIDFVIGMSRGGLVPAALLAGKIDKPLAAAYINKQDEIFFDRADWVKDKNVLVVDDVVRSGKTLWLLKNYLDSTSVPKSISFFTLFKIKSLLDNNYKIPVFSREIDDDVVFPWDYDRK